MKPFVPCPASAKVRLFVKVDEGAYHTGVDCAAGNPGAIMIMHMSPICINSIWDSKPADRMMVTLSNTVEMKS